MPTEPDLTPGAMLAPTPDRGPALCLSGGGFRATLFHLGVLRRLNELGVLSRLEAITSVSGGSITNGVLATRWSRLRLGSKGQYDNFDEVVARPTREFCGHDLRTPLLLGTRINPLNWGKLIRDYFAVSANFLAAKYEPLYERANLASVPAPSPGVPRFIFCATNVTSGACWHFHGGPAGRMGDFYTGYGDATAVSVGEAVAASSAFPPGFSALRLRPPASGFTRIDPWGVTRPESAKRGDQAGERPGDPILLTDGGVYDNLGVEPIWTGFPTLLVSDAGRIFESDPRSKQWLVARLKRVTDIGLEQVAAVRKRWFVADHQAKRRSGAIWSLHTQIENFTAPGRTGYGPQVRSLLHRVRTDLDIFSEGEMGTLENHGYSLADAAVRSFATQVCSDPSVPFRWPHAEWSDDAKAEAALKRSSTRQIVQDVLRYVLGRAG